jgi:hypothetical protein
MLFTLHTAQQGYYGGDCAPSNMAICRHLMSTDSYLCLHRDILDFLEKCLSIDISPIHQICLYVDIFLILPLHRSYLTPLDPSTLMKKCVMTGMACQEKISRGQDIPIDDHSITLRNAM